MLKQANARAWVFADCFCCHFNTHGFTNHSKSWIQLRGNNVHYHFCFWSPKSCFKVSATLQDRQHADCCSAFIFLINPNKPHIFWKLNCSRLWLILLKSQNRQREHNWDVFCESICLCKFNSSSSKNEWKRTINIAFASWHVLLKNHVSDFWHVHLFICDSRIKSEGTNHQHFLWKQDDYLKVEKENKNRRQGFRGKLSHNKLAKFQLNWFRGCQRTLNFPKCSFRENKKIIFLAASNPQQDYNI